MPDTAAAQRPPPPRRPGRAGAIAWRAGWVLLAAASMAVAYILLVVAGR
jgi:hypothetical protein